LPELNVALDEMGVQALARIEARRKPERRTALSAVKDTGNARDAV
jgi:hypothetical protein